MQKNIILKCEAELVYINFSTNIDKFYKIMILNFIIILH